MAILSKGYKPDNFQSHNSLKLSFTSIPLLIIIIPSLDEVFSINPSANVFVFGDFNTHNKDILTKPILVGLIDLVNSYNFSNDLTQMVNFCTRIAYYDFHTSVLLHLFISSDVIICSTMAFPPLGNSDHVVVLVSIVFRSNSKQDALFYCKAYDYSHGD